MLYQYLEEKGVSLHQMSQDTGIPYKTLDDLKNCKIKIEDCKADTLYKISQYFEVPMEEMYTNLRRFEFHDDFEIYKNDLCHFVEHDYKNTLKNSNCSEPPVIL